MKIGEFFEKHVQWIALGLAAAWLLWVGWTYGVNRPTIEIGGQAFSPGDVDEHIRAVEMERLTNNMANPSLPAGLVDVPDFTDAFVSSMNGQTPKPLPFAIVRSDPPYQESAEQLKLATRAPREKHPVKQLPDVVPVADTTPLSGRSQVIVGQPLPKLIVNPNGQVVVAPAAQPAQGGAAVQPVAAPVDKTWITLFGKWNAKNQDKKFEEAKVPPYLWHKLLIEVQLQRQEVLPDGGLGKIELVKGLPMNETPVDRKAVKAFLEWSAQAEAQKLIAMPKFYDWVKGAVWEIPQKNVPALAANANVPPANDVFNVQAKYQEYKNLKTPLERLKFTEGWTPEQKQQFHKHRIEQQRIEEKARQPQRPPAGGRGGAGGNQPPPFQRGGRQPQPPPRRGGDEGFDAIDPQFLRDMYASGEERPSRRPIYRPLPEEMEGLNDRLRYRRRGWEDEGMVMQPQPGQVIGNILPDINGNIDVWAHDETAVPGRTYRYRMRVVIKNPIYTTADPKNGLGVDPKMNEVPYLPVDLKTGELDLEKSWSDWSKAVAIPTNVDMMFVGAQMLGGRELARFRVKRFQEGQVNEAAKPFEVAPGDTIGGLEKVPGLAKPIDFTTTWTVVDIRQAGSDVKVRIMDPQGRMEMRTVSGDRNRFKDDNAPAKPVAGAVGGGVGLVRQQN